MNRDQLIQQLLETMVSAFRGMTARMHHPDDANGLSRPQVHIMFALSKSERGMSVKELAQILSVTSAAVSQFTDELVAKGLLLRQRDTEDRRGVRLVLTDSAKKKFVAFRDKYFEHLRPAFGDLSDDELEQFIHLFHKIKLDKTGKDS